MVAANPNAERSVGILQCGEVPESLSHAFIDYNEMIAKSLVAAGVIGSVAAACECEIDGNVPIEPKDVDRRLDNIDKQSSYG